MSVNVITAVGMYVPEKGYPIGRKNTIPWKSKSDMKWFKDNTMGHPVIMGKNTWKSLPKPLEGRCNIIVSWDKDNSDIDITPNVDVRITCTVEEAITIANSLNMGDVFIIGGGSIYKYAIENDLADNLYIDFLSERVDDADTFFPQFDNNEWTVSSVTEVEKSKACGVVLSKCNGKNNHVDEQYFSLINDIIKNGEVKDTRAGKTRSLFGKQIRFNLKEGLPILTTKKVYTKGVIHELLWFLKGDTNIKYLVDNNVHIWDDDAYRYYLELMKINGNKSALTKDEFISKIGEETWLKFKNGDIYKRYKYGDLNNVYGYQWTKWGGHNQIQEVIDTLKTNPDDRRMIVSAWNVAEIPTMALPPCHYCYQFYTKKMTHEERMAWAYEHLNINPLSYFCDFDDEDLDKHNVPTRKLSCCFHMRGTDCISGLPFNITSYSLLTFMVAQCVNMDVDEIIYEVGDCHIYENHIKIYESEQKNNNPYRYALPKLVLNPNITNIFDFKYEDIKIEGYKSYPTIKYSLNTGLDKINF